jgi:hypothetical protein
MSDAGLRRKFNMDAYVARVEALTADDGTTGEEPT